MNEKVAMAIGAHPDDIEMRMAGTLLLLKQAGWEIHVMNVANGSLGSAQYTAAQTRKIRRGEAQEAARTLGAHWHPSLVNDLEVFYDFATLKRLAAVVREVSPAILLTHPPQDYMEDHINAGRLAVSAAFVRGAPNFRSLPPRESYDDEVTIYHCTPHGLQDPLGRPVVPAFFTNTTRVFEQKHQALSAHQSQANWLETSQGVNAYLSFMEEESLTLGKMSRKFKHAEGWWRHLHFGFCGPEANPLREALGKGYLDNPQWKKMISI